VHDTCRHQRVDLVTLTFAFLTSKLVRHLTVAIFTEL